MQALLHSEAAKAVELIHLETADRRGMAHVGRVDLWDALLAVWQCMRCLSLLILERPQLIYLPVSQSTYGFMRDAAFIVMGRVFGARPVVHLHGGGYADWYRARSAWLKALIRRVYAGVAVAIVLGETLRTQFEDLLPPERIAVVANGIDCPADVWPRREACMSGTVRVVHLGTQNAGKGTLDLLQAAGLAIKKRHDLQFVFAGPWNRSDDERRARALIGEHHLERNVDIKGPVAPEAKWELLRTADILVFCSRHSEGQPLVVLEAMAAGVAILYVDTGCLRETLDCADCGLEAEGGDIEDLSRKILTLADDPHRRTAMAERAHRRYETRYTLSAHAKAMVEVFRAAASG